MRFASIRCLSRTLRYTLHYVPRTQGAALELSPKILDAPGDIGCIHFSRQTINLEEYEMSLGFVISPKKRT
jgi:hypothetical protein